MGSQETYQKDFETCAIGVDLGATKIAAALVSNNGRTLAARQVMTLADQGPNAVLDRIAELVNGMLGMVEPKQLLGVGIGSPGQVDPRSGVVRNAVNLGWKEVELTTGVASRLHCPLSIWAEKDANASALGEYTFGTACGISELVYLGIGSGLGGGAISNGTSISGANLTAMEVGHLSLDPSGLLCTCGNYGCAETTISGRGLSAITRKLIQTQRFQTCLDMSQDLHPSQVLEAARQGDPLSLAAITEMGQQLGFIFSMCAALLNPSHIVIGGGLGLAAFDLLIPPALKEMARRCLPAARSDLKILRSTLESPSIGAAALVWYHQRR